MSISHAINILSPNQSIHLLFQWVFPTLHLYYCSSPKKNVLKFPKNRKKKKMFSIFCFLKFHFKVWTAMKCRGRNALVVRFMFAALFCILACTEVLTVLASDNNFVTDHNGNRRKLDDIAGKLLFLYS